MTLLRCWRLLLCRCCLPRTAPSADVLRTRGATIRSPAHRAPDRHQRERSSAPGATTPDTAGCAVRSAECSEHAAVMQSCSDSICSLVPWSQDIQRSLFLMFPVGGSCHMSPSCLLSILSLSAAAAICSIVC